MKWQVDEINNSTGEVITVAFFKYERDAVDYCDSMECVHYSYIASEI